MFKIYCNSLHFLSDDWFIFPICLMLVRTEAAVSDNCPMTEYSVFCWIFTHFYGKYYLKLLYAITFTQGNFESKSVFFLSKQDANQYIVSKITTLKMLEIWGNIKYFLFLKKLSAASRAFLNKTKAQEAKFLILWNTSLNT